MNQKTYLRTTFVAMAFICSVASADEPLKEVDTTPGKPPSDATVIFDGENTDMLVNQHGGNPGWPIADGAITVDPKQQSGNQGLWTKLHFHDAQIHVEFRVPTKGSGNSGLYLHGLFEQQIINSYQKKMKPKEIVGSVYNISPPLVNAARPPGEWQVYDIIFRAPKRDEAGEAVEPGTITSILNGVLVQQNAEFTKRKSVYTPLYYHTTDYSKKILESLKKTGCGPMQLQDHGNHVSFRNIWIRPLDDKAFVFQPEE